MQIQSATFTVEHVRKSSTKSFDEVIAAFEKQLGVANMPVILESVAKGGRQTEIEKMEGSSGLMIFASLDMTGAIPSIFERKVKARQYLVGNPLIADQMMRHNIEVGLYVPLRIFIAETENGTTFVFDKPTSLLGQWGDERITEVANSLEEKLQRLIDQALS